MIEHRIHGIDFKPIHNVKEVRTQMVLPAEAGSVVFIPGEVGGASRDRTDDLKLAKLALSQLSYGPASKAWWAEKELNLRPHAYQACALTT